MEEDKKPEDTPETPDQPEGDKPSESTNILEDARTATKEMKEQLDRREKLVEREEAIAATNMLGGKADAGQTPEPKKEMTGEEYTRYVEKHGRAPDDAS